MAFGLINVRNNCRAAQLKAAPYPNHLPTRSTPPSPAPVRESKFAFSLDSKPTGPRRPLRRLGGGQSSTDPAWLREAVWPSSRHGERPVSCEPPCLTQYLFVVMKSPESQPPRLPPPKGREAFLLVQATTALGTAGRISYASRGVGIFVDYCEIIPISRAGPASRQGNPGAPAGTRSPRGRWTTRWRIWRNPRGPVGATPGEVTEMD